MNPRAAIAIVITIVALFTLVTSIDRLPVSGNLPIDASHLGECGVRVTAADPGAAELGLRPGDLIDFRRMPPDQRSAILLDAVKQDSTFALPVERNGRIVTVPLAATPTSAVGRRNLTLLLIIAVAWTFFGMLALWFGRDPASQYAGVFLTLITINAFSSVPLGVTGLGNFVYA